MIYGCQGSYLCLNADSGVTPNDIVTLTPESGPGFQVSTLQSPEGVLIQLSEALAPGRYRLSCSDTSSILVIIPRYVDWADLPALPIEFSKPLCEWANAIQYQEASGYDEVTGLDFVKSLPTDWGDHLLSRGVGFDDKVLDVGTGTGRARLSAIKKGFRNVFGVDASEDCLKRQRSWQELLDIPYVDGQLRTSLDPSDHAGSFGAVILSSALHHFADTDGFLAYCSRLLKPGGLLIASMEPTNKRKFHAASGDDTTVDLAEACEIRRMGSRRVTYSVTLLAEFWDGSGFTRSGMEDSIRTAGLELVVWDVSMWTSFLVHNFARNYLPSNMDATARERFSVLYLKSLEVDAGIKALMPDFARQNFYCATIVARKPEHHESPLVATTVNQPLTRLAERVREAFELALGNQGKLDSKILELEGMSGKKYRMFINNLIGSLDDARYLEIGSAAGLTLYPAIAGNGVRALAIGDWPEFDGLAANLSHFKDKQARISFLNSNFQDIDFATIGKYNVYFYDGPHGQQDHYEGATRALPALDDEFVLIVDDWNWATVRAGTMQAVHALGLRTRWLVELRTTRDDTHPPAHVSAQHGDWHNGYMIGVFAKAGP